jgi:starvation-inducible outer membrane lipoprotein
LRAKDSKEKQVEKIFNDTHLQYPPPQKRWRPKVIEVNQTDTKTENEIATVQLPTGTIDSPAIKAGPSMDVVDCPTLEFGPCALR